MQKGKKYTKSKQNCYKVIMQITSFNMIMQSFHYSWMGSYGWVCG